MELTVEEALKQGVTAHKEGRLEDAERFYRAILKFQPEHADANHNLGLLALSVGKVDAALPFFEAAIDANPEIEQFWLSHIKALVLENENEVAAAVVARAKRQGVDHEKLDALLTQPSKKKENENENVDDLNPPQQQLSNLLDLYQTGKFGEAENLARLIIKQFPKHHFAWKVLGALLGATGRKSEALDVNRTAVELSPLDAAAHSNLGLMLQEHGRLVEAEASHAEAIRLKPDFSEAHLNLGITLYELGRSEEAEASFTEAIRLKPELAEAHCHLGSLLRGLGRLDEATSCYSEAIRLKPNFFDAHINLGITRKELGRLDEAEASYREAIRLKPDIAEAHSNLGNVLKERGKLKEAESSYKEAIRLRPDYAEASNNLGITLNKLGRLDEAETSYRTALRLRPDFVEAHNNLGLTLIALGKLEDAIECLKQATKLNPDSVEARNSLSRAYQEAVPSWHFPMMNDEKRATAYFDAMKLAIDDGAFVLDIGTGSGLLSLMAAACGAEKVVTCETSQIIAKTAVDIIESNGYGKKISVLNKKSNELIIGEDLPHRADLIVSEVLSSKLVGEGARTTLLDANKRLLKKNGRMIPQSGKIKIALVAGTREILNNTSVTDVLGFDLSKFNSISQKTFYLQLREKPLLLSDPEAAFNIDLCAATEISTEEKIIQVEANKDGICVGLIQWLWIQLYKDVEYENMPGESDSHWGSPFYAFDEPFSVRAGDVIDIKAILGEDNIWFFKAS